MLRVFSIELDQIEHILEDRLILDLTELYHISHSGNETVECIPELGNTDERSIRDECKGLTAAATNATNA
jgi:hypothetical protein